MPITATIPQSANYAPKSNMAKGFNPAVVFHVEDLGLVPVSEAILIKNRAQRQREGKDPNSVKTAVPKARVWFNNAQGQIITQDYTLSLHEKARLTTDLKRMGKTVSDSFDVETLNGTQVQLLTEEATSGKGNKYIKIAAIAEPAAGQNVKPLPASAAKQNGAGASTSAPASRQNNLQVTDADIPF